MNVSAYHYMPEQKAALNADPATYEGVYIAAKRADTAWRFGELGLHDRSSAPRRQRTATPGDIVARIAAMRRDQKWCWRYSASRLKVCHRPDSRNLLQRKSLGSSASLHSPRTARHSGRTAAGGRVCRYREVR